MRKLPPLDIADKKVRINPSLFWWLSKCEVGLYLTAHGVRGRRTPSMVRGAAIHDGIAGTVSETTDCVTKEKGVEAGHQVLLQSFEEGASEVSWKKGERVKTLRDALGMYYCYTTAFWNDIGNVQQWEVPKREPIGGALIGCRVDGIGYDNIGGKGEYIVENKFYARLDYERVLFLPLAAQSLFYPVLYDIPAICYYIVSKEGRSFTPHKVMLQRNILRCRKAAERLVARAARILRDPKPRKGAACSPTKCALWGNCPYGGKK